ncbi:hypothetical protein LENED_007103 [Lentinula edodes]|uniref:Velvet domain-containing protein n=1 Tax=Lentinula edodes TaxID=5353 RepID=A0A1Q3EDL8_LENED|nr:hypothetical protein LENED_007103 [Lentinula edodes]
MSAPFPPFEPYIDGMTVPRLGMDNHVYATGDSLKGQAIYFETGQWGGRIIRTELHELQHANTRRKYSESDKSLFNPSPVVALRLFELTTMGQEYEISSYEDIETTGLLCVAELIPVVALSSGQHTLPIIDALTSSYQYDMLDSSLPESPSVPESQIARITANVLVGTRIVRPHLIELDGQKHLVFVFSNLSVRSLGLFRLRYKFFDLFSAIPGNTDTIIQAECIGGIFRVLSPKDYPGPRPPTSLTNTLSAQGIFFNPGNSSRKPSHGYTRRQSDGT